MAATITLEDLHAFHSIDRKVFTRLVINLMRNPAQSLLVMAMWLWLEETRSSNIIATISTLSDGIVNALANEATTCLRVLEYSKMPPMAAARGGVGGGSSSLLPITATMTGINISLPELFRNKFSAVSGMKSFLNNVCALIFSDILQQVLYPGQFMVNHNQAMVIPGFPHPTFGGITVIPRPLDCDFPVGGLWGWSLKMEVPEDDRTMFLTFSRGYPVTEAEVRELFTSHFGGDCVDSIQMGGYGGGPGGGASSHSSTNPRDHQPLYARMVVRSVSTIDRVLNGEHIAKLGINGKHVWARKYERRETPPPPPPHPPF